MRKRERESERGWHTDRQRERDKDEMKWLFDCNLGVINDFQEQQYGSSKKRKLFVNSFFVCFL